MKTSVDKTTLHFSGVPWINKSPLKEISITKRGATKSMGDNW